MMEPDRPVVLHPDDPRRKPTCANELAKLAADVRAGRVICPPRDEWHEPPPQAEAAPAEPPPQV